MSPEHSAADLGNVVTPPLNRLLHVVGTKYPLFTYIMMNVNLVSVFICLFELLWDVGKDLRGCFNVF